MKKFCKAVFLLLVVGIIATATWACSIKTNTITYEYNFDGAAPIVKNISNGEKPIDLVVERDGYIFDGWFTTADCVGEPYKFSAGVTTSVVLYAKWTKTQDVTITFNSNGGTGKIKSLLVKQGAKIVLPNGNDIQKTDYALSGWTDGVTTYAVGQDFTATSSVQLSAVWSKVKSVNFRLVDATGELPQNFTTTQNSFVLPKNVSAIKPQHTFVGWVHQNKLYSVGDTFVFVDEDNIFTAAFSGQYTVSYSLGFTAIAPQSVTAESGSIITLPSKPSRDGFLFVGWADGFGSYDGLADYTVGYFNITISAVWQQAITVTYMQNEYENNTEYTSQLIYEGDRATKPTDPTRANHDFMGWYSDEGCKYEWSFSAKLSQNTTLYAGWKHEYFEFIPTSNPNELEISRRRDIVVEDELLEEYPVEEDKYFAYRNLEFPETYDGKTIVGIFGGDSVSASGFFLTRNLINITKVPKTYRKIGGYAFSLCYRLKSITFEPGSQLESIGAYAFNSCRQLNAITIPKSVKEIGNSAFLYCVDSEQKIPRWGLSTVVFEEGSACTLIDDWAFGRTFKLSSINIPNTVKKIGDFAFNQCDSLKTVTLPNQLEIIGRYAFAGCNDVKNSINIDKANVSHNMNFKSIVIPRSVTQINGYAFAFCDLSDGITFEDGINLVDIGQCAFYGSKLKTFTVPDCVTGLGFGAFMRCESLTEFNFSTSTNLVNMGSGVFSESKIANLDIPEGVENIFDSAFYNMPELLTLKLPKSLKMFGSDTYQVAGSWAVASCHKLKTVDFAPDCPLKLIDSLTFVNCFSLESVNFPKNIEKIGDNAFGECSKLTMLNFPENSVNFTSVDGVVYSKDLKTVVQFPQGKATTTGGKVTVNASGELSIAEGVTKVGIYAFYQARNITSIKLPASLEFIDYASFRYMRKVTTIEFANNSQLKHIGNFAFGNNTNVVFNSDGSIKEITSSALTTVIFTCEIPPEADSGIFVWSTGELGVKLSIKVPSSSVQAYKEAEGWSDFAEYISAI